MRNFQDTFETRKRLFISAFSICMTVPLSFKFIAEMVLVIFFEIECMKKFSKILFPTRYCWVSDYIIDADKEVPKDIMPKHLIPFDTVSKMEERLLIGHNVSFDRSFLASQYKMKVCIKIGNQFTLLSVKMHNANVSKYFAHP